MNEYSFLSFDSIDSINSLGETPIDAYESLSDEVKSKLRNFNGDNFNLWRLKRRNWNFLDNGVAYRLIHPKMFQHVETFNHTLKEIKEISSISKQTFNYLLQFKEWLDHAEIWAEKIEISNPHKSGKNWRYERDLKISYFKSINNGETLWGYLWTLDVDHSPNLNVGLHKYAIMDYERNQCLIYEIEQLIEYFKDKITHEN